MNATTMSPYASWLAAGNSADSWESERVRRNEVFRISERARLLREWQGGAEMEGLWLIHLATVNGFPVPTAARTLLCRGDVKVSLTQVSGIRLSKRDVRTVRDFVLSLATLTEGGAR